MRARPPLSAIRALTPLAIIAGALATLSYATGAPRYIRAVNSPLGTWLETYQFPIMEAAATALGLLVGIRIAARITRADRRRPEAIGVAILLAAVAFFPLMLICEAAARFGWSGNSATVASWLIGHRGYEAGLSLDSVLIAGVYFLKTAVLALLAGAALAGFAAAIPLRRRSASVEIASHGPRDAA